ncbi:hypothetical protein [Winogradskyella forsetii]|uniref:hypothetical protein n=1 Tax=Winogradskyella forsetii TaxID=2686077 RepID=UPI0015BAE030|nr:hypothetical protein [Winogradskyella forsetii]
MKSIKYIFFIFLLTLVGCESERNLNGNYSTCHNGLYAELYIENDSMRSATSMDWISNWREYKIKNDTLYHLYFGEWSDSTKAKINFIRKDYIELYYPQDSVTHSLKRITEKINVDSDYEKFWNGFNERKNQAECVPEYKKRQTE